MNKNQNYPFKKRTAEDIENMKKMFGEERTERMLKATDNAIARIKAVAKQYGK
jgi:ABC-type enterochelin transport system substrate-binding protein